jgi:hypothetical protein
MVCMCRKPYRQKHLCDWERMATASASYSGIPGFIIFTHRPAIPNKGFCNISHQPFPVKNLVLPQ